MPLDTMDVNNVRLQNFTYQGGDVCNVSGSCHAFLIINRIASPSNLAAITSSCRVSHVEEATA